MQRWFTSYQGEKWDQKLVEDNLSENFGREMESLIELLGLEGPKGKPKHSRDLVAIGGKISVYIKSFTFREFKKITREYSSYYTPVFRFDLVVSVRRQESVRKGLSPVEDAYSGEMTITFEEDYPNTYPVFKLPKYSTFNTDSHSHHMYTGGKMCLYADFGSSQRAWDRDHDTSATAFAHAMRWIVWHELWRGRGVDADDINNLLS